MNGDTDLVFIGARFRLDGESDGGLRQLRRRVKNGRRFVAKSLASGGFLQFGDGPDVSGVKFADFRELLSLNDLDMLKTFRKVAIVIRKRGVIFQDSALYLEIVDAARERIGKRLVDKQGKRLAVIVLPFDAVALAAGVFVAHLGVLIGMRERVSEEREEAGGSDAWPRRRHQNGKSLFGHSGFADGGGELAGWCVSL